MKSADFSAIKSLLSFIVGMMIVLGVGLLMGYSCHITLMSYFGAEPLPDSWYVFCWLYYSILMGILYWQVYEKMSRTKNLPPKAR
jgi:hypothetical protein